jgi:hypothetical protein
MIKSLVLVLLAGIMLAGIGCNKRIREADAPRQAGDALAQR